MSWLRRRSEEASSGRERRILWARLTRFRQLLRCYGLFLDQMAEAAERRSASRELDRAYALSLTERVLELTDAAVFDLVVLGGQEYEGFYDRLESFQGRARELFAGRAGAESGEGKESSAPAAPKGEASRGASGSAEDEAGRTPSGPSADDSERAASRPAEAEPAAAVARAPLLYGPTAQVAGSGIAAGPVFPLTAEEAIRECPAGSVLLVSRLEADDVLMAVRRRAAAILAEAGEITADTARLVREARLPVILGLADAARKLAPGARVTVDGEKGRIFAGEVAALLTSPRRAAPEPSAGETDPVAAARSLLFPLTLDGAAAAARRPEDCDTLHDLIYLAQELAGESIRALLQSRKLLSGTTETVQDPRVGSLRLIDLAPIPRETSGPAGAESGSAGPSAPLAAFLSGVARARGSHPPREVRSAEGKLIAVVKGEQALMASQFDGFDLIDCLVSQDEESNYLYGRFADSIESGGLGGVRGAVARETLARLGFASSRTPRAVTGWLSGLPPADLREHVIILGSLYAYLGSEAVLGAPEADAEHLAEAFVVGYS